MASVKPQEIISRLSAKGVSVSVDRHGLVVWPAANLTDEDRQAIRARKAELLALLRAQQEEAEIDRIARLDKERNERDRLAGRGYDHAPKPSPAELDALREAETARLVAADAGELDPAVLAELARIEPDARRLGWPPQRIWGASFWPIEARGLADVIEPGDRIIELTTDYLVIEKDDPRGTVQRFWRCNA